MGECMSLPQDTFLYGNPERERERARMEREEGETRLDRGNRSQGKLCGQGVSYLIIRRGI